MRDVGSRQVKCLVQNHTARRKEDSPSARTRVPDGELTCLRLSPAHAPLYLAETLPGRVGVDDVFLPVESGHGRISRERQVCTLLSPHRHYQRCVKDFQPEDCKRLTALQDGSHASRQSLPRQCWAAGTGRRSRHGPRLPHTLVLTAAPASSAPTYVNLISKLAHPKDRESPGTGAPSLRPEPATGKPCAGLPHNLGVAAPVPEARRWDQSPRKGHAALGPFGRRG